MRKYNRIVALIVLVLLLAAGVMGCASQVPEEVNLAENLADLELVPLAAAPTSTTLTPTASGTDVRANDKASIDVSNMADGYVMVRYTASTTAQLMVIVKGPSGVKYTYYLNNKGTYEVFPLSDGNGSYTVSVYRNVSGDKYATEHSATLSVKLKNEFAPFLLPNQYVNYSATSKCVTKAAELTKSCKTELDSIKAVYNWVVKNLTYDKVRAASVKSGYLPNLDDVMAQKKGICFDYAALMTAMLRSQGIACKLVVGYSGKYYHAWINAYSEKEGWIDGVIYFDGKDWKLMDPTFASSSNSSDAIMKYIGDGKNYSPKFLY